MKKNYDDITYDIIKIVQKYQNLDPCDFFSNSKFYCVFNDFNLFYEIEDFLEDFLLEKFVYENGYEPIIRREYSVNGVSMELLSLSVGTNIVFYLLEF